MRYFRYTPRNPPQVNFRIDEMVLEKIRALRINVSEVCRNALEEQIEFMCANDPVAERICKRVERELIDVFPLEMEPTTQTDKSINEDR